MKTKIALQNYQKIEFLGQGTYGIVYKAKNKYNNEIIAVKNIKLNNTNQGIPATTMRQITILRELAPHPNIISLKQVLYQIQQNKIDLIFEYAEFDLKKYLDYKKQGLTKLEIKNFMYQLVKGINYCHTRRIIHRDLKPQNILITEDNVLKIADFGLARVITAPLKTLTHQIQTLWYRAPQILLGERCYHFGVDIWAIGCIFGELIQNQALFNGKNQIDQIFKIFQMTGTPTNQIWPNIRNLPYFKATFPKFKKKNYSQVIKNINEQQLYFLQKMINLDPLKRISMKDALGCKYFDEVRVTVPDKTIKKK